jgi:O-antigen/teichoic acid export membrane protein
LFKNVIGTLQNQIISVTFFATLFLALLSNLDVLLAKYFLDSYTAGSYGAISTLGKIVLFATGAFVTVMLPLVSKSQDTNTFYKTFFALFCSGLAVVAVFYIFSTELVHLLFGLKYEGIIFYVPTFALAIFFVSLSTALVNYFLAVKNKSFLLFLGIGIFVECLLLWYNHATINGFVHGVLYANILLTILLGLNFTLSRNQKKVHEKDIYNNSSL